MGIADRGYMHAGGNGGRSMGPRSGRWTITTWIIVLCCGVWFVDGFFPSSLVRTDLQWNTAAGSAESQAWVVVESWPSVANGQVVKGAPRSLEDPPQGRRPDYLVLAPVDAPQGGQAVYRRFHPIERWLHFSTMEGFCASNGGDCWDSSFCTATLASPICCSTASDSSFLVLWSSGIWVGNVFWRSICCVACLALSPSPL